MKFAHCIMISMYLMLLVLVTSTMIGLYFEAELNPLRFLIIISLAVFFNACLILGIIEGIQDIMKGEEK